MDKFKARLLFRPEGMMTANQELEDLAVLGKRAATAIYFGDEELHDKNCKRSDVHKWIKKLSESKINAAFFGAYEAELDKLELYYPY